MPTTALYTAACVGAYQLNTSAVIVAASVTIVATIVAPQSVMTAGSAPGPAAAAARPRVAASASAAAPPRPARCARRATRMRVLIVPSPSAACCAEPAVWTSVDSVDMDTPPCGGRRTYDPSCPAGRGPSLHPARSLELSVWP